MSVITVTTRITRQYLERKTKSDLAQMYLDLLDDHCRLESNLDKLWHFTESFGAAGGIANVSGKRK